MNVVEREDMDVEKPIDIVKLELEGSKVVDKKLVKFEVA